jgi:hypothetical protein|tara:strand:+ start:3395 stop:3619 length:225 start_codon:yes stop_codon:yes gene_type:complete
MTDIVKNATQNPVTGDRLVSKASNQKYRDNWELAFGKKPPSKIPEWDATLEYKEGDKVMYNGKEVTMTRGTHNV